MTGQNIQNEITDDVALLDCQTAIREGLLIQ